MKKVALILHGWPRKDIKERFLLNFLQKNDYEVFTPNLYVVDKGMKVEGLVRYITSQLKGKKPDLIVGISMGGLILPHIAERYPSAKLIFIATSAFLKPQSRLMKIGFRLLRYKFFRKIVVNFGNLASIRLLMFLHKVLSPSARGRGRDTSIKDLRNNLKEIKCRSFTKHLALYDLICRIDNTDILKKLKNTSLIFNGSDDRIMPLFGGEYISNLLHNCTYIVNKAKHFNVFKKQDLDEVGSFLKKEY